jgi:hypothetical protein
MPLHHAALALLASKPAHGYEVTSSFELAVGGPLEGDPSWQPQRCHLDERPGTTLLGCRSKPQSPGGEGVRYLLGRNCLVGDAGHDFQAPAMLTKAGPCAGPSSMRSTRAQPGPVRTRTANEPPCPLRPDTCCRIIASRGRSRPCR